MSFFDLPMTAGPRDPQVGIDELGRPVFRAVDGTTYGAAFAQPPAPADDGWKQNMLSAARDGETFDPGLYGVRRDIGSPVNAILEGARGTANALAEGFTAPGRALRGEPVTMGNALATALDFGLMGAPMAAPQGALRTFAGRNAKTADLDAMARAERMLDDGMSRDDVWRETGWFRGTDGKMRFEIDDSRSAYDAEGFNELLTSVAEEGRPFDRRSDTLPVGGIMDHSDLYDAYPDMSDMDAHLYPRNVAGRGVGAAYSPQHDAITIVEDLPDDAARSFVLHEQQHAIQKREGFATGGNIKDRMAAATSPEIEAIERRLRTMGPLNNDFIPLKRRLAELKTEIARENYLALPGEVEARNVQTRRDMTPEQRRAAPPWQTQDR